MALNENGDASASARLIVDLPAPSGPMSATENIGNLIVKFALKGLWQSSLGDTARSTFRDSSVNLLAAKSGHHRSVVLALVLGYPRFAKKAEVAEANVPVIFDLV